VQRRIEERVIWRRRCKPLVKADEKLLRGKITLLALLHSQPALQHTTEHAECLPASPATTPFAGGCKPSSYPRVFCIIKCISTTSFTPPAICAIHEAKCQSLRPTHHTFIITTMSPAITGSLRLR